MISKFTAAYKPALARLRLANTPASVNILSLAVMPIRTKRMYTNPMNVCFWPSTDGAIVHLLQNTSLDSLNQYVSCSGVKGNKSLGRCFSFYIYRPYPMHSARQYTHYSCSVFKSDSFYNSQGKPFLLKWVPRLLDRNALLKVKIALLIPT